MPSSLLGDLDLGHFGVLVFLVLFDHSVESLLVLAVLQQCAHFPETREQRFSVRFLVLVQDLYFGLSLENRVSERDCGQNECLRVVGFVQVGDRTQLKQELAHVKILKCIPGQYKFLPDIPFLFPLVTHGLQQMQRSCIGQVEPQRLNNPSLHILQLLHSIGVIGDINIIVHLGRVDFFVLTSNPQTSNAHELVLVLGDIGLATKLVQVDQGQVQSLFFEVKRLVDFDHPVDQHEAHVFVDVLEELALLAFLYYHKMRTDM